MRRAVMGSIVAALGLSCLAPAAHAGWRETLVAMRELALKDATARANYVTELRRLKTTDLYIKAYAKTLQQQAAKPTGGTSGGVTRTALASMSAARVQLNHTPERVLPYVPLPAASATAMQAKAAGAATTRLKASVTARIDLPGDPLANVHGSVLPIRTAATGGTSLLHFNGFRFAQLFDAAGKRVWRIDNPGGRTNDDVAAIHRDSWAILDLDGDGGQDIVQCWSDGTRKLLQFRRGRDGKVMKQAVLDNEALRKSNECYIQAYRMKGMASPLFLVAARQAGGATACGGKNYVGYFARVEAYDDQLNRLWSTDTCNAGHTTAGVDVDLDGYAERVFVGKYALDRNGRILCTLAGWDAGDHVDALSIGELIPGNAGLEVVAVGATGGAIFAADSCKRLATLDPSVAKNPQQVMLYRPEGSTGTPNILTAPRGSEKNPKSAIFGPTGKTVRVLPRLIAPMQNADLDGGQNQDEIVAMWGEVYDDKGNLRLGKDWYWNLKGKLTNTTTKSLYPTSFDRWAGYPLFADLDGDGRDEIVTWSQNLLVVGKVTAN